MNWTLPFTLLGQAVVAATAYRAARFIWIYFIRQSSLPRYLKAQPGTASYALVTGSSDGIGLRLAAELLKRGFNVILHGRNEAKLAERVRTLKQRFPDRDVRQVTADATDVEASAAKVAGFVKKLEQETDNPAGIPKLRVLINNLGGNTFTPAYSLYEEMTAKEIHDTTAGNALFQTHLTHLLLPSLLHHTPSGTPSCILNICVPTPADIGQPFVLVYQASKQYCRAFSAALRHEMQALARGRDVVEVLAVAVGDVPTASNTTPMNNFMTASAEEVARDILDRVGLGGQGFVVANWRQALPIALSEYLPLGLVEDGLRKEMIRRRRAVSKSV